MALLPVIIGHRGGGAGRPLPHGHVENTPASFAWAFRAGAHEVECDLAVSGDGVILVHHDAAIKTGLLKKKPIAELTLAQVKSYGPHIPTLSEIMRQFPEKPFCIELKSSSDYRFILRRVYDEWVRNNERRFRFLSFSLAALQEVKRLDPRLTCTYIATCIEERFEPFASTKHIAACRDLGIEEIAGDARGFRPRTIAAAQESGLEVGLGMVNSHRTLRYCVRNNVRRWYTDRIEWILESLSIREGRR